MSDQDSIFTSTDTTGQPSTAIDQLVGEGKKFATVEALVQGKLSADEHIRKIEAENRELRENLARAKSLDEALKEVKDISNQKAQTGQPVENLGQLIDGKLAERELAKHQATNMTQVTNELIAAYGDANKAKEAVAQRASELGVSVASLDALAKESPQAFFRVFSSQPAERTNASADNVTPTKSTSFTNTTSTSGVKTLAQVLNERKATRPGPHEILTPAERIQIQRDIAAGKISLRG